MLSYKDIVNKIDYLEEANILISALELSIFSILEKRSMSANQVSSIAKTQFEGTETLLNALSAMGALTKYKNTYKNTPVTYKYFCELSPEFKKGTVTLKQENRGEYEQLSRIIKKGRDFKAFEGGDDPKFRNLFTYAMHERSELYADDLADKITRKPVGRLIDLGCGPGSYSVAILKKDKAATATLMDRPVAIKAARKIHKNHQVYKRLKFISGDLFDDEFGVGYNTALLSNVIHIYNIKENRTVFKKIGKVLEKGGRLILYDFFLEDNQIEPYDAALFAITMLLYTKTGKSYTFDEVESLLRNTGFARFKRFKVGYGSSVIEAIKN